MIGRIRAELGRLDLADNTVIIYMGDNGYYMGDRGFAGKWSHYEQSLRVPLIVYDPRLPPAKRGAVNDRMALNIDVPATILDLAGVEIPPAYQGRSLLPLVGGEAVSGWRTYFFCEHRMNHPAIPKWEGVRGSRYVYARYYEQNPVYEFLHDLKTDPDELVNLASNPAYGDLLESMRNRCSELNTAYAPPNDGAAGALPVLDAADGRRDGGALRRAILDQPPQRATEARFFRSARPIWPDGRQEEMNLSVGFTASVRKPRQGKTLLRLAGCSIYRVRVNGQFVACGPARGPHGFYRVDEWDISDKLDAGENVVAVEVAGYNVNSFYLLDQPSFLQAEVTNGDEVLASTAGEGTQFAAHILECRLQKVQRYSFQRPFSEVYRLNSGFDRWLREASTSPTPVKTAVQIDKKLLPRRVLYPTFTIRKPLRTGPCGVMQKRDDVPRLWKDRSLTEIGPALKGYREDQLAVIPTIEAQHYKTVADPTRGEAGRTTRWSWGIGLTRSSIWAPT